MRKKVINLKPLFGKKDYVTIIATSCSHFGNPSVSEEGLHNLIMKCKKHPWIHHGDIIEGIMKRDKRHSVLEHADNLLNCMYTASEWIKKANKTCIGLIHGNHDQTPSKEIGDVVEYIAGNAAVPYLTASCLLKFKTGKKDVAGFFAHGSGSSNNRAGDPERKQLNRQIWLRNRLNEFDADIKGMGHLHRFVVCPPCEEEKLSYGDDDAGNVKRRPVLVKPAWHYAAPSMFTTYNAFSDFMNYAEMAMYGATDMGWIEFDIQKDGTIPRLREVYHTGIVRQERYATIVG